MHTLKVWGAEGCCDGTTSWKFRVNGGEWEDFTVPNLNKYGRKAKTTNKPADKPERPSNACDGIKSDSYEMQCENMKGKHYEKVTEGFAKVDVCTVMVNTAKKESCA